MELSERSPEFSPPGGVVAADPGDMGQPYARNGYFHLYINGLYWGVYDWEERTEADFAQTYLGGNADTTDTIKSAGNSNNYLTETTDGNFDAWQNLNNQCIALKRDTTSEASRTARLMQMQGLNPDGSRNPSFPVLLDLNNLIDYLLVIFYDGSFDAPLSTFLNNGSNNWFGSRDRNGTRGFAFFIHDNEHGFDTMTQSYNRVGPWGGSGNNNWGQGQYGTRETFNRSNPQYLHELLAYSSEYRLHFADRVQKHYFNGGALTTAGALNRMNALANQVALIIHAEAARWGSSSLNRNSWTTAKNTAINFINNGGTPIGRPDGFSPSSAAELAGDHGIERVRGRWEPNHSFPTFPRPLIQVSSAELLPLRTLFKSRTPMPLGRSITR